MKKLLLTAAFAAALAAPTLMNTAASAGGVAASAAAQDDDLILTLGRLRTNSMGATQTVSVENRTAKTLRITVECGYYAGNNLVGSGGAIMLNVQPGSTGYQDASALGATDADNAKCRIEEVQLEKRK